MKWIFNILILIFSALVMLFSIRGIYGNPTAESINNPEWKDEGPFELSPERGRFALTMSIVEDKSFYFSLPIARFATPDLGFKNGNYVSLFAPGVSFILMPGYLIGSKFFLSQVGTYAVISFFAILNLFLIRAIAMRLGANSIAGTLGGFAFLFATPAFAYGVSLYQHHISIFLILSSIYLLLRFSSMWVLFLIWFLSAAALLVDYPNFIFMFPIGIFALGRIIFVTRNAKSYVLNFRSMALATFITVTFPIVFFMWFNKLSYDNPFQLSGTIEAVKALDEEGRPISSRSLASASTDKASNGAESLRRQKSAVGFFNPRNLLNGFYTHFISLDRGILWYAPVVLFGILGFSYLYRVKPGVFALLVSIVGANVILYSMWGDPWGGWAFGSRYLIPSYAILSIFVAFFLTRIRRSILLLSMFFIVFSYSVFVNTLGALTSSRNPPQVEVLSLEKLSGKEEKYTFERNLEYLASSGSKSYMFQTYFRDSFSVFGYFSIVCSIIIGASGAMLAYFRLYGEKR